MDYTIHRLYEKRELPQGMSVLRFERRALTFQPGQYLQSVPLDTDALYFLCGNCEMIYDVHDRLKQRGVPAASIKAEVYF